MATWHRDISFAILIDSQGRFLFRQRDDVPGIVAPGKIGLFGGHREGNETFLECMVREVQEETGLALPRENFLHEQVTAGLMLRSTAGGKARNARLFVTCPQIVFTSLKDRC